MRRYNIVSGILLFLSIIDFALAAPVSMQEKRQEHVDVVHMPKDVITVLEERWEEDLEKLGEEYLKTGGKPVDSSSSTASGPDHGSTNVVQPPVVPNPASSTTNPEPLTEPSSCLSSTSSREGMQARGNCLGVQWSEVWAALREDDSNNAGFRADGIRPFREGGIYSPLIAPTPILPVYGDHELSTWAQTVQQKKIPNPKLLISPSADPDFNWEHWINAEDPPTRPASPEEFGQAQKYRVNRLTLPSTSGYAPSPPEPEPEVMTPSSPSSNLGPLSLSEDPQPVDAQAAAIYAAKGKAKVSRHISGNAIDVGNAVQRESQSGERSLDQGE